jgi:hypothetical protein
VTNEENESWDWKKVLKFCLTWSVTYWNSYKENKDENNDKKEEEETK